MSEKDFCRRLLHYLVVTHVKVGIDCKGGDDEENKGNDGGKVGQ